MLNDNHLQTSMRAKGCRRLIVRDVTELKKAKDALKSGSYRKAILNSICSGLVVIDEKTHQIVDVNANGLEIIGASREHIIGKVCHKFICPAQKGECPISDLSECWHPLLWDCAKREIYVFSRQKKMPLGGLGSEYMDEPLEKGRIDEMIEAVMKVARGDYSVQIKLSGENDELDSLGMGLNMMIDDIREHITELKHAEKERTEAAATQEKAAVIGVMHDSLLLLGLDGKMIYANPAHLKMFGHRSVDEIVGKSIGRFKECFCDPEKDVSKFLELFNRVIEKGFCEPVEITFRKKDGKEFVVSASGSLLRDAGGNPKSVIVILRDITERKKMQDNLQESENKYRTLLENLPQKIFFKDKSSVYISCNENYARDLKIKPDEIAGKADRDFFPKGLAEKYVADDKRIMELGETEDIEEEYVQEGQKVYVHTVKTPVKEENGNVVGILGIFWDVTERRKTEEALRESEEKYRNLFQNARDVIVTFNLKGKLTSVNKTITEYGFREDEIVGKNMLRYVSKKYWLTVLRDLAKACRGKSAQNEVELITPKGKKIAEYRSNPIKRENKIIGVQSTLRDITERKNMEEKLRQYSEHLEELVEERTRKLRETQEQLLKTERLATIGELAAMVGHDLRNPLQSIKNATSCLKIKLDSELNEATQEILKIIDESIEYSNGIICDLLDYSREMRLELTETMPRLIIRKALSVIKVPENIQMIDSIEDELRIRVDVDKMRRVFVNIIKNAIEAMPEGGKLVITSKESNGNIEPSPTLEQV
jgi:PAS domain S-box-containing protein